VEGTITNQQYLQQLQNEAIPVTEGAQHVDTTLFQQEGACLITAYVNLDVLHDVFGNHVLLSKFPEHFGCAWSQPPCSPDMSPCDYFLWGYLKDSLYHTNWQLCGLFTASPKGQRISNQTCSHETTCSQTLDGSVCSFMYHMVLHHRQLRTYHTKKLLRVFLNTMYLVLQSDHKNHRCVCNTEQQENCITHDIYFLQACLNFTINLYNSAIQIFKKDIKVTITTTSSYNVP